MRYTFLTEHEAVDELQAHGWTPKPSEALGVYWTKPSKVDDWYGGGPCTALVTLERRRVAPEYGGRDYFEVRFL